jgi:hypothetical protein
MTQNNQETNWPKTLNIPDFLAFIEFQLRTLGRDEECIEGICNEMEELGITALETSDSHCERTEQILEACKKEGLITIRKSEWPTPAVKITEEGYKKINKKLLKDYAISHVKLRKNMHILARNTEETKDFTTEYGTCFSSEDITEIYAVMCHKTHCYNKAVGLAPNNIPMCEECLYKERFPKNSNEALKQIIIALEDNMIKNKDQASAALNIDELKSTNLLGKAEAYGHAIKLLTKLI